MNLIDLILTLGPPNPEQALEAEHTPVKHRLSADPCKEKAEAEEKNPFLETLNTGTGIHLPLRKYFNPHSAFMEKVK